MSSNNEIANELQKLNKESFIEDCIEEQKIEEEIKENQKKYDEKLKELIDAGGFSMEGIIEIKMICHLIRNCPSELENKKEDMAKCLEILVNMSNQFLQLYKKQNE
tara:strand:- start:1814 stop:2131 length:318 start_codon:yes stop_codon:yes gene_type:complete